MFHINLKIGSILVENQIKEQRNIQKTLDGWEHQISFVKSIKYLDGLELKVTK